MADLLSSLQAAAGAGGGNPNAWDVSKAYYDPGADAGDLSKAIYTGLSGSIAQDTLPTGVFFKPDGTKFYIAGNSTDMVREYNTLTPWRASNFSYVQLKGVSPQDTNIQDVFFKPDGTKMYITGATNYKVYEYDLSTAWDISSASFVQDFSVSSQGTNPSGIYFKPDGTKMYTTDNTSDTVNEYSLSTPWDISSASYVQNFSVSTQDSSPNGLTFLPDGTKLYVVGSGSDKVYEYTLSTAWDVSSASFVQDFSVSSQDTIPVGMFMKDDGSLFYVTGLDADSVYQYIIGGFSVAAQETLPQGLFFKPDGTKMYITGAGADVNEYSLSTAWDITTASYVQVFSVSSQSTDPTGVFFKGDGTRMYIVSSDPNDNVNEYSLSIAWDVSTASYVQNFSVTSQDIAPSGIFFKDDGTKMYIAGYINDNVYEYSLSTAWDISSASYVQSFSVTSQENTPRSVFFKDDGTKMYVIGTNVDAIQEYALSSAWDISTASFTTSFRTYQTGPTSLFIRGNGEEVFVVDTGTDRVYKYSISEE